MAVAISLPREADAAPAIGSPVRRPVQPVHPVLVATMCAAIQGIGGGLGWSSMPALMPAAAKDLGLGYAASGLVFGAASLGIAVASPLGGVAVDRFGARRTAGVALLAGALACAARAFGTGTWSLALAMLVFGLHIGFAAPAVPNALAGHVHPSRIAGASALGLLAYTLGTALTMRFGATTLLPLLGSWRAVMLAAAAAMAASGVLWLLLVRDGKGLPPSAKVADMIALVRDDQVRRVATMHFLVVGGYLALLSLLPRALESRGVPPTTAGNAMLAWLVTASFANYAGPWLSDVLAQRRPLFVGGAAVAGLALASVAAATLFAPSKVPFFLVLAAIGGGSFAPLLLTLPLELAGVGPTRARAAVGLLMLVGQIGGFLLPVLSGAIAQASGPPAGLAVLAVAHLLVVVPARGLRSR